MPASEPPERPSDRLDGGSDPGARLDGANPLAALLAGLWQVLVVGVVGAIVEAFRRVLGGGPRVEAEADQRRRQDDDGRSRDGGGGSDESR